ncbi:MAG: sulfotransferase family 2 domain-containing protein [Desulfobulbaceae bacterium]|nr:sulfotransferase family 2 domain-containing protein [Desulfobulbaceae bacterium]
MIISHKYRFIFIKTHKTAGSSLEMTLAPLCAPDDIVTPMESNARTDAPRNFHGDAFLDKLYAKSRLSRKVINRHSALLNTWYYEHMPAWRVKQQIGEETWNSYYKFCFERNPWDKVVSYYFWKKHGQSRTVPSFREYVLNKTHRLPQDARLYFDNTEMMVDKVYEFWDLKNEIPRLCKTLKIPFSGEIPREKTGIKSDRKPYQEYYDDETRTKVAEVFAREINAFHYVFD